MKAIDWVLRVVLLVVFVLVFYGIGPALETKYWPVYSKFTLIEAEKIEEGTRARFRFTKFRNCDPRGFGFFAGDPGANLTQLHVIVKLFEGQPHQPVPLGTQETSPYIITGITPEQLSSIVFAEVYSHCHPFWITRTKVFP